MVEGRKKISEQEVSERIPTLFGEIDRFVKAYTAEKPDLPEGGRAFVDATITTLRGPIGVMIGIVQAEEAPYYRIDASNFETRVIVLKNSSENGIYGTYAESRRRVRSDSLSSDGKVMTVPFSTRSLDAGDLDKLTKLTGDLKTTQELRYRVDLRPTQ